MTVNLHQLYQNKQDIEAYNILKRRLNINKINLSIIKKKKILNIGDASGRYSKALIKLGANEVVTYNEFSKPNNWPNNYPYINNKLDKLNYLNEKYDFIFCNGILSHKRNWKLLIKKIRNQLNHNGWLWLSLYGKGNHWIYPNKFRKNLGKARLSDFVKALVLRDWPPEKINFLKELFFSNDRIYFTKSQIKSNLLINNFSNIIFLNRGIDTDLNEKIFKDNKLIKIYGEGEIRLIAKAN